MKKILTKIIVCFIFVYSICYNVQGQIYKPDSTKKVPCGLNHQLISELRNANNSGSSSFNSYSVNYPNYAKRVCGAFELYFEDFVVANNNNSFGGFADATYSSDRINTLCAVLQYIQTTIDVSNVTSNNGKIRIYVDQSLSQINPVFQSYLAKGGPFIDLNKTVTSGYVNDYILDPNGADPNPNGYHGYLKVNFYALDQNTGITYNNTVQPLSSSNCGFDLYSVLLHEMGHILGWISLLECNNDNQPLFQGQFSDYDKSIYVSTRSITNNGRTFKNPIFPINSNNSFVPLVNSNNVLSNYKAENNFYL